ncbi:O-antigen ligase family protein [Candidatus Uhrbacteria bacterium]|nr:O-antigen ligase family protein [Candidatus Uhrbacteria bacterium]
MREKLTEIFLLLTIFLLPWQTRWIFSFAMIGGEASQYGTLSLYATEFIIFIVVLLRGKWQPIEGIKKIIQAGYFLFGTVFFSLAFTSFFLAGIAQIFHFIFAFALFTLLCDVRTNIKSVGIAFIAGLIIPSVLGLWQVIFGASPASTFFGLSAQDAKFAGTAVVETATSRTLRAHGSFPHPNIFGGYIAVSLVSLSWIVRMIKTKKQLIISSIPAILFSVTLIITFSRGAWIAVIVGFLILLSFMFVRRRAVPSRVIPIMIIGFVSLIATFIIFYPQIFARFEPGLRVEKISIEERVSQYSWFDDVLRHNPLFGVGPGAYTFALQAIDPEKEVWNYQPIHNIFLLILGEIGIFGFIVFLNFILRVDQISARVSKQAGGMFGLTLGVVLIILGLFDHYLWSLWPGLALGVVGISLIIQWSKQT